MAPQPHDTPNPTTPQPHSPCAWPRQRCRTRTVFAIMCCGQCTQRLTRCHPAPFCSQLGKHPAASAETALLTPTVGHG